MLRTAEHPALQRVAAGGRFDEARVHKALRLAQELYGEQVHWTGETLLQHALGTLEVLAPFEPDEDAVIACILQHALEGKRLSLRELEEQFGPKVRELIGGIHLLTYVSFDRRRNSVEDLRLLLLSVSDDLRIVLITLCTWVYALRFFDHVPPEDGRRMARAILHLYAPVAARLGIYRLKHELEDGAFPILYPDDAAFIAEQIVEMHSRHPHFLERAETLLADFLRSQGIRAEIGGREKQSYSIFLKMNKKSISHVETLYDLFALRVIVSSEEDCYRVLGMLHRLGRPVPNRFKDYISFPKPNGYQSLHTTLAHFGSDLSSLFIEVQIRTEGMDREATYGVAAHWSYKESGATLRAMEKVQLHTMLLHQEQLREGSEAALADHIYVLTPRGDIIELPESATPLDFAFQVHTELGLAFRAARVNGAIVPLNFELQNGDIVEIIRHPTSHASPEWMQLLKMASSRSKLRSYLNTKRRAEYVARGRMLLNEELQKRHLPPLTTDLSLLKHCDGKVLSVEEREDLLMKIGQGSDRMGALLPRLDALREHFQRAAEIARSEEIVAQQRVRTLSSEASCPLVEVDGGVRMPYQYAHCCCPDETPGCSIHGVVNRSGHVMVHEARCRMLRNANPERRVRVEWKS